MNRPKLINILPLGISVCLVSTAFIAIDLPDKKNKHEKVQKIIVNWGHVEMSPVEEEEIVLDYVPYDRDEEVGSEEEKIPPVTKESISWIETDDTGLINYAKPKSVKLSSDKWTLSNVSYKDYDAPIDISEVAEANTKTYMKYQTLGYDSWNRQGHLARQSKAYTGEYSLRMIDGRIFIAVGSYYCRQVGTYIDVLLEDGTVLPCIMGDAKANKDTDITHRYQKYDKSVIEFIIDSPGKDRRDYSYFKTMYPQVHGNFSNIPEFSSPVKGLRVYDKVYPIDMNDVSNDTKDGDMYGR